MKQNNKTEYYLVNAESLPEVFVKVVEAKRCLETGEAATVAEAVERAGLSRSAFYKYKDAVVPFADMSRGRIVTFQVMLKDNQGVLSALLSIFAQSGANILTINQSIPVNGCAACTVSVEVSGLRATVEELMERMGGLNGVIKIDVLAGQ